MGDFGAFVAAETVSQCRGDTGLVVRDLRSQAFQGGLDHDPGRIGGVTRPASDPRCLVGGSAWEEEPKLGDPGGERGTVELSAARRASNVVARPRLSGIAGRSALASCRGFCGGAAQPVPFAHLGSGAL